MTLIGGLYITDLCENKTIMAVSSNVQKKVDCLRTEGQLSLSVVPVNKLSQISFKVRFLNICHCTNT